MRTTHALLVIVCLIAAGCDEGDEDGILQVTVNGATEISDSEFDESAFVEFRRRLDEETALIYPPAYSEEGLALIRHFFPRVIEAPEREARELFACNAHSPDGKHVVIQRGCTDTNEALRAHGFDVIEVDTDEYLKSGGSVFCMKLMTW